jgi:hypothetical protein
MSVFKKSSLLKSIAGLIAASVFCVSTAYAAEAQGITMINHSGAAVTLSYDSGTGVVSKAIDAGGSLDLSNWILSLGVPTDNTVLIGAADSSGGAYCGDFGSNYYNDLYTGKTEEYPVLVKSSFVPYDPSNPQEQPFLKQKYHEIKLDTDLLSQSGVITLTTDRNKCFFNHFQLDHKSASITAYAANSSGVVGSPYSFDLQKIFIDKTPDPTLLVSPVAGSWPKGLYYDSTKGNVLSTFDGTTDHNLQPGNHTIQLCACDTQLVKSDLGPGEAGSCGDGNVPVCGAPPKDSKGNDELTWIDTDTGSIGSTLTLQALSGIFTKTPDDIATDYKANPSTQKQLMIDTPYISNTITVPIASFFKTSSGVSSSDISYRLVDTSKDAKDVITGRNNGNDPTGSDPSQYPLGAGWGPVIIHNGAIATPLTIASSASQGSINLSGGLLQIFTGNQTIKDQLNSSTNGIAIQATVEAISTTGSVKNAYQTIYILVHKDPSTTSDKKDHPVNLLQHRVQAWAYAPTVAGLTTPDYQPGVDATCNLTSTDGFSPLDTYLNVINTTHASGDPVYKGLTEITPDIGWIQFPGTLAVWPTDSNVSQTVFSNNATTSPYIGCFANYFKNKVSDPENFKFIVTMEFDSHVHGYVPNLNDQPTPDGQLGAPLSQVSLLSSAVLKAANPEKIFTAANLKPPAGGSLVDGIQFDVEPLPAGGSSETFFKRTADLLAREGKINQIFAFADADSAALVMAQGPLGLFLPSAYDIGATAYDGDGTFKGPHADNSSNAFWGDRTNYTPFLKSDPVKPGTFHYPQSFIGQPSLDPVTAGTTPMDYFCHWKQNRDVAGSDQPYIIGSYCNYDQTNSIFNNAERFNSLPKPSGMDFETRTETFHGHYSLAIPAEGSATAWNYVIIYNPRLANGSGGACDTSKGDPCVISGVPNTYTPEYVGLDYTRSITDQTDPKSEYGAIKTYITTHRPAFGTYDVFYATTTPAGPSTTPACSMDAADDPATVTVCNAIVIWHNDGSVDSDNSRVKAPNVMHDYTADGTSKTLDYVDQMTQGNYTNIIYALANTTPDSTNSNSLLLDTPLGTPATNPDYNTGVAMYALSSTTITGCSPGGSHGENANCPDDYPTSFMGADPAPTTGNTTGIWTATNNYMQGTTWTLNGGSTPPTPPTPGKKPSVQPEFYTDNEDAFNVQNVPTGGCTINTTYPDSTAGPSVDVPADGIYTTSGFANDPIKYAISNPDETYTWAIVCGSKTLNSGTFHRYGDKIQMWLVDASGTKVADPITMNEADKNTQQTWSSLPAGTYTVDYEPKSLNDMTQDEKSGGRNSLVTPTLGAATVAVKGSADSPVQLSFKQ